MGFSPAGDRTRNNEQRTSNTERSILSFIHSYDFVSTQARNSFRSELNIESMILGCCEIKFKQESHSHPQYSFLRPVILCFRDK